MISVIVPIYNVEPYLRHCIDSILSQTYHNLEIILIDDGSTDCSGKIADSYQDPRIRVLHTDNHGLSTARNLGIGVANGEYLCFVDSDDWIEPELLNTVISEIGDADIVCFGFNNSCYDLNIYNRIEAISALINEKLPETIWSKLYRKEVFKNIRFPDGRVCEDIATTYKLFLQASSIVCINKTGYHYTQRQNSICHTYRLDYFIDNWNARLERYNVCKQLVGHNEQNILLESCAFSAVRFWLWKNTFTTTIPPIAYEISSFSKKHFPISFHLPLFIRIVIPFTKHPSKLSFWFANNILKISHFFR